MPWQNLDTPHLAKTEAGCCRLCKKMAPGQYLQSQNGEYKLTLQSSGDLILYKGDTAVWVANEAQPYSETLNRNFRKKDTTTFHVARHGMLSDAVRKRYWTAVSSFTRDKNSHYHAYLLLQDDGNIVIVDVRQAWVGTPAPFQAYPHEALIIEAGTTLEIDKKYTTGGYSLVYQRDGNMVIYDAAFRAIWISGTAGHPGGQAIMQHDGNFVIYNSAGAALWQSKTTGLTGSYVQLQSNGGFGVVHEQLVWARSGFVPEVRRLRVAPKGRYEAVWDKFYTLPWGIRF